MEEENKEKGLSTFIWMLIAGVFGLLLGYSAGFVHGVEYLAETSIEALNMLDIRIDNIEFDFNETQMIETMVESLQEIEESKK